MKKKGEKNRKNPLKKYHYKMRKLNYPNIHPIKTTGIEEKLSGKQIHCFFVGTFYKEIRNPEYMFRLFSDLRMGNIMLHVVGASGWEYCDDGEEISDRIKFHGKCPAEEAFQYMKNADVLVSLNNTVTNQMPGKIFDYISTGKPIINICKIPKCPTLKILERYPLVLNILEGEGEWTEIVNRVIHFCSENWGKSLSYDEVEKLYHDYTIENVGRKFEDMLKAVYQSKE